MALPERWFRTWPDSSVLERPRVLARSLIDVADLDNRIAFYERLLGVRADLRMPIPNFGGLELAAVGNLLLIASARGFTPIQRQTAFSLIVPSLAEQLERLQPLGVTVLEPVEEIMPGSRARVRYPDGALAELVEHRPQPGEAAVPRSAPGGAPGVKLLARRGVPRARFEETVAFYESAFEVGATALDAPGSPAVVGSALLVGENEPRPGVAFALLSREAHTSSPDLITLGTGAVAELWGARDCAHDVVPHTGAAGRRP